MSADLLRNRWQQLSEPVVRRLQAEKLRHYLRATVLPFSAHYQKVFRAHGLDVDSFHTLEDLERIPFTSKADLVATAEQPQKFRDFILVPDPKVLTRRPEVVMHALLHGKEWVKQQFEAE